MTTPRTLRTRPNQYRFEYKGVRGRGPRHLISRGRGTMLLRLGVRSRGRKEGLRLRVSRSARVALRERCGERSRGSRGSRGSRRAGRVAHRVRGVKGSGVRSTGLGRVSRVAGKGGLAAVVGVGVEGLDLGLGFSIRMQNESSPIREEGRGPW
eukprot:267902-Rhodomonas_salina.1